MARVKNNPTCFSENLKFSRVSRPNVLKSTFDVRGVGHNHLHLPVNRYNLFSCSLKRAQKGVINALLLTEECVLELAVFKQLSK